MKPLELWCLTAPASLVPLLWASSCDAELTATLQSEQYNSRRAFSSSVSGSVSPSCSTPGSRSGSGGGLSCDGLSSPPAAEVASGGAVATVVLGTNGEATGAGVGVLTVAKDTRGCANWRIGRSGKGVFPGRPSVETYRCLRISIHHSRDKLLFMQRFISRWLNVYLIRRLSEETSHRV